MWPRVSSLGAALELCQGASSSVGRAPRWLPVDKLPTQSPCCLNTPPRHECLGNMVEVGNLGSLALLFPAVRGAGNFFSQGKVLAHKNKTFSQFLLTFPPFLCSAVATKTGVQQSVQSDVMLAGRQMGGRGSLPYLVPPVCPGPLTLTLHVTSEGTQTGSDCSHSTEAEVASNVTPSGGREQSGVKGF